MHEQYKETLFGGKQMWHGMKILRSEGHEINSIYMHNVSLSAFDLKRWIAEDGITTYAYGYTEPINYEEILEFLRGGKSVFGRTTSSSPRRTTSSQLFPQQATLRPIVQIVENGLIMFGK